MSGCAIIGGTGLGRLPEEWAGEPRAVATPFGEATVWEVRRGDQQLTFLPRHGDRHGLAPHQINYRANIAALRELGVRRILATNAVGSLRLDLPPGSLVALDDFIDFTSRHASFWDEPVTQSKIENRKSKINHTDFSQPYCPLLREALMEVAASLDLPLLPRATYVCTDGPRFESPAEVRMFAQWGGDVVGMTGLPEATLAREAGICYAAVGIVTNFAAGLTPESVDHERVVARMAQQADQVRGLFVAAAGLPNRECHVCGS